VRRETWNGTMDHGDHGSPHGFADLFLGVELGHSFAQHHYVGDHGLPGLGHATFADAVAEALAISVALENGGPGHLGGLGMGGPAAPLAPGAQPGNADWARPVALPGLARGATAITVLQWPHDSCDPQGCIREEAARQGLQRHFPEARDGNSSCDDRLNDVRLIPDAWPQESSRLGARLAGYDIWDERAPVATGGKRERPRLPNGWFQGVGGRTRLWREFYQTTPSLSRWLPWGRPNYETWRTYLMVSGITWSYRWRDQKTGGQIGDCETLISFAVVSYPFVANGVWTYKWPDIREHRGFTEKLAQKVSRYLAQRPANARAK
jgi:hypothetical protein